MPNAFLRPRGRLTIPREIRAAAQLVDGDPIEIELVPEGILLRPQKPIDTTQTWFWTPEWQAGEQEATADLAAGRGTRYELDEEFLAALDTPPSSRRAAQH